MSTYPSEYESALTYRDNQIADLMRVLSRWQGNRFKTGLDIAVLDRAVKERNEFERNLIIAQNTINVLIQRKEHLEEFAKHFEPQKYADFLKTLPPPLPGAGGLEN